jgi:hypothetical protein
MGDCLASSRGIIFYSNANNKVDLLYNEKEINYGTIQRFNGSLDEDCEGHINTHINGVNDDYDNVDDIVKWIEFT